MLLLLTKALQVSLIPVLRKVKFYYYDRIN